MSTEIPSDEALLVVARELALILERRNLRLVLAESCTAGLAAAQLARVPGISRYLCGSAVVYQEATKTAWLGVPAEYFQPGGPGVVSGETAAAMADGVLERTPPADLAVAITGHLGPGTPVDLDGLTFHGWATRIARPYPASAAEIPGEPRRRVLGTGAPPADGDLAALTDRNRRRRRNSWCQRAGKGIVSIPFGLSSR